ncbi:hypothetical protein GCM10029992_20210 [Glycomyces albus]
MGAGRPGWHIECSAMARRYLGDAFDIHGGGTDIMFPHHENELAQSRGAGLDFAEYWVHNGMLNLSGTKMSKSLGNTLSVSALGEKGFSAAAIRYYLSSVHYRSAVDFSEDALGEAQTAWERLSNFTRRAAEQLGLEATIGGMACSDFVNAMDDDLNTPPPSPRSTTWPAKATPPSTPGTTPPPPASPAASELCSTSSASTRSTRTGTTRATPS